MSDAISDIREQYLRREAKPASPWIDPQTMHQHIGILLREIDHLRDHLYLDDISYRDANPIKGDAHE